MHQGKSQNAHAQAWAFSVDIFGAFKVSRVPFKSRISINNRKVHALFMPMPLEKTGKTELYKLDKLNLTIVRIRSGHKVEYL